MFTKVILIFKQFIQAIKLRAERDIVNCEKTKIPNGCDSFSDEPNCWFKKYLDLLHHFPTWLSVSQISEEDKYLYTTSSFDHFNILEKLHKENRLPITKFLPYHINEIKLLVDHGLQYLSENKHENKWKSAAKDNIHYWPEIWRKLDG